MTQRAEIERNDDDEFLPGWVGCEGCEIEVKVKATDENCPLCGWPLWESEE